MACKEGQIKRRINLVVNGHIKSDEFKTDFQIYKRIVLNITNKNNLLSLENIDKRGLSDYHLDHKFSISEGFKQGILPEIIGNIINLEMIDSTINRIKSTKCSITRELLFEKYSKIKVYNFR